MDGRILSFRAGNVNVDFGTKSIYYPFRAIRGWAEYWQYVWNGISSGVLSFRREQIIECRKLLLPVPTVPPTRMCGVVARFPVMVHPSDVVPTGKDIMLLPLFVLSHHRIPAMLPPAAIAAVGAAPDGIELLDEIGRAHV